MQQQRPHKRRAILTEQQAIEIFGFRSANSIASATFVAKRYGINERTVRDIWKQRTWTNATSTLAEVLGPMAKKKMGRPIGSKDIRPRKQKPVMGNLISFDPSNAFTAARPEARPQLYPSRPMSECHASHTDLDQIQQDIATRRHLSYLLSDFMSSESSNETALLDSRSLFDDVDDERHVEEASLDDQLHAWARCGSQWIIDPALSLDGEAPPDGVPSVH